MAGLPCMAMACAASAAAGIAQRNSTAAPPTAARAREKVPATQAASVAGIGMNRAEAIRMRFVCNTAPARVSAPRCGPSTASVPTRQAPLYRRGQVGYGAASGRSVVSRCCRNLRRMTAPPGRSRVGGTNKGLQLMTYSTASAPGRRPSRTLAARTPTAAFARFLVRSALLALASAAVVGSSAYAQQPATSAPKHKKSGKPATEAQQPAPPAEHPATPPAQGQQGQQAQNGQQPVQLIFSPWTKFCLKGQPGQPPDPNAK